MRHPLMFFEAQKIEEQFDCAECRLANADSGNIGRLDKFDLHSFAKRSAEVSSSHPPGGTTAYYRYGLNIFRHG